MSDEKYETKYPLKTILKNNKKAIFIKEGLSRKVYDLNDGYILKVAKNKRGIRECDNEFFIYNDIPEKYKKFLCPIIRYEDKYTIMPKIETKENIEYNDFVEKVLNRSDIKEFIEFLVKKYNVDELCLSYSFNWGYYNNEDVLLDYGENYFKQTLSDGL